MLGSRRIWITLPMTRFSGICFRNFGMALGPLPDMGVVVEGNGCSIDRRRRGHFALPQTGHFPDFAATDVLGFVLEPTALLGCAGQPARHVPANSHLQSRRRSRTKMWIKRNQPLQMIEG